MDRKVGLTNLELYKEADEFGYEEYYLKAEYLVEEKYRTSKVTIPKIWLPIEKDSLIINNRFYYDHYKVPETTIDLGFGELHLEKIKDKDLQSEYYYKYETIEERAEKMTLEEIEKKLGHKIELVSKK